ncbi:MAG TPA: transketolase [Treponema sp.]|nr:MAG: transketolase [Treponema sp. GWA1_62_8]OHE65804.1 MAG: transketolase [Treponema sp. GWC1_61_84]OHE71907.1 MAG: transketolase [Treponema sp. RIFOXYC1_FULL_61_9]HCM28643.1 transketolase [Treponema sp.]
MEETNQLRRKAIELRKDLIAMIYGAKTGHTGGSLSSLDILTALFYGILKMDSANPAWPDRDRFVLSKGHSVEGYYNILADKGFFPKEELATFSKFKTRLIGHPNVKVPGIEMNTGALGHGLSASVGMALAGKMDAKDYRVFVLMGDGELAEGSIWEGAMAAANFGLDNLVGIVDRNRLQISGDTEKVMRLDSLKGKWTEFGWEVREVDGHDILQLLKTFRTIPFRKGKPSMVIANTVKGKDISFMENVAKWHHGVPSQEQMVQAFAELDSLLADLSE